MYSETGEEIRRFTLQIPVECEECGLESKEENLYVCAMREVDDKSILFIGYNIIGRLNLSKGKVMWRYEHHGYITDAVYDGHGNVICIDPDGDLFTLDVTSGKFMSLYAVGTQFVACFTMYEIGSMKVNNFDLT